MGYITNYLQVYTNLFSNIVQWDNIKYVHSPTLYENQNVKSLIIFIHAFY